MESPVVVLRRCLQPAYLNVLNLSTPEERMVAIACLNHL